MKILVIDDDDDVRDMLCMTLEDIGHEVDSAANGKEAFTILGNGPEIDLVITDIVMPEKEGMETIRELKQDHPHVKILAISGGGRGSAKGYLDAAEGLGADLTLGKPFSRQSLLDTLDALFPSG